MVNISFNKDLLALIDEAAHEESRSRSELIREAARFYIERKKRWESIFSFGDTVSHNLKLSEAEMMQEIKSYRAELNEART